MRNSFFKRLAPDVIILIVVITLIFSCQTVPQEPSHEPEPIPQQKTIIQNHPSVSFVFTGDIMAHAVNAKQKSYEAMYQPIKQLLANHDAVFGNLEFVIDATRPYQTYPRFNVQPPYVEAVINAGFSVFSLANNHTADWGIEGILQTKKASALLATNTESVFSGLKNPENANFTPEIFTRGGIRIAFLAVTEFLNEYTAAAKHINVIRSTTKARQQFIETVRNIKQTTGAELLILSIHTAEPEYIRTVTADRKAYFRMLSDAGADVIWANHPHVPQPWEIHTTADGRPSVIMYSLGNFISGQRYTVNIKNPDDQREYTGDSIIMRITFTPSSTAFSPYTVTLQPSLITTITDTATGAISLHELTEEFIQNQPAPLLQYYQQRAKLMRAYLPLAK